MELSIYMNNETVFAPPAGAAVTNENKSNRGLQTCCYLQTRNADTYMYHSFKE